MTMLLAIRVIRSRFSEQGPPVPIRAIIPRALSLPPKILALSGRGTLPARTQARNGSRIEAGDSAPNCLPVKHPLPHFGRRSLCPSTGRFAMPCLRDARVQHAGVRGANRHRSVAMEFALAPRLNSLATFCLVSVSLPRGKRCVQELIPKTRPALSLQAGDAVQPTTRRKPRTLVYAVSPSDHGRCGLPLPTALCA